MWMLICAALAAEPSLALPAAPSPDLAVPRPPPGPNALAAYRQRATSVRRYTTLEGGGGTAVGWGFGWPGFGSPYGGFSTTYIIGSPTYAIEHWAVYRGSQRLTVPGWMDVTDAPEARQELRKRVRRTKAWHRILIGTAIAGGVASVGASWASQNAATYEELLNYRLAATAGTTAMLGGALGAYGTGMNARNLRYDFDATQDLSETQERVRAHNERLREELGLTPEQTRSIDQGTY